MIALLSILNQFYIQSLVWTSCFCKLCQICEIKSTSLYLQMQAEKSSIPNQKMQKIISTMISRKQKVTYLQRWNQQQQAWKQWSLEQSPKAFYHTLDHITTMTLNVLFDREYSSRKSTENVINSRVRYDYIITKTGEIMPDVITYNEATPLFFEMLKKSQWARHYWISQLLTQGMGNIILTKFQPIFFDTIRVDRLPRQIEMIVLPIKAEEGRSNLISFSSIHLTAYQQNLERRTRQFNHLVKYLQRYDEFISDAVFQGDMNFHNQTEKSIFQQHHLLDAWLTLYDLKDNPGYTFNSAENSLINEIYWGFQRRKMRLDRVLFKGNVLKCKEIQVNFNEPIFTQKSKEEVSHHMFLKGGLLFLNDYLGLKLFRKQKESFLFPSDHFGLIATLQLKNK